MNIGLTGTIRSGPEWERACDVSRHASKCCIGARPAFPSTRSLRRVALFKEGETFRPRFNLPAAKESATPAFFRGAHVDPG